MLLAIDFVTLGHRGTMMRLLVICRNCLVSLVPVHYEPLSASVALRHLHHLGLLAQVMGSLTGTTMTNLQGCFPACTHGHTHRDTHTQGMPLIRWSCCHFGCVVSLSSPILFILVWSQETNWLCTLWTLQESSHYTNCGRVPLPSATPTEPTLVCLLSWSWGWSR